MKVFWRLVPVALVELVARLAGYGVGLFWPHGAYKAERVVRGRYWVNAQGIGGVENGPPRFNLALCGPQGGGGRSGGSSSRTYCDAGGNCSTHGLWGWVATTR